MKIPKPCIDCQNGPCNMNCGPAIAPVNPELKKAVEKLNKTVAKISMRHAGRCPSCGYPDKESKIIDDREPAGMGEPKKGTYLFTIKSLWKATRGQNREFLAKLYDHLNALYVEQQVYRFDPKNNPITELLAVLARAECDLARFNGGEKPKGEWATETLKLIQSTISKHKGKL